MLGAGLVLCGFVCVNIGQAEDNRNNDIERNRITNDDEDLSSISMQAVSSQSDLVPQQDSS